MGKGTIVSHIGDGQYSVTVNFYKAQYDKRIAVLDKNIASLTEKMSDVTLSLEKYKILALQKAALQKEKKRLQDNFPEDETIEAWCADLTKDLSGEVGTIEIPGEDTNIQIAPGYKSKAAYVAADSGQLVPTITQGVNECLYNFCLLPGWQKWKPTYRYGIMTSKADGLCNITLETALSSQQKLDINQTETLSNVPFDYMSCNGAAFSEGDNVLIQFTGQNWDNPKVVGFKDNPKPCGGYLLLRCYDTEDDVYVGDYEIPDRFDLFCVFDFETMDIATDIPLDATGTNFVSFPCSYADLIYWRSITEELTPHTNMLYKASKLSTYVQATPSETITAGGESFYNHQEISESGGEVDPYARDYYGDFYNVFGVSDYVNFTWTVEQPFLLGYDCTDVAPHVSAEKFTTSHNGSDTECFYNFQQDWQHTYTFKAPFLEQELYTTEYHLNQSGTGGETSFDSCELNFTGEGLGQGLTGWVKLDPQMITLKIRTESTIVLINYISWNTQTQPQVSGGGYHGVTYYEDQCALDASYEISAGHCGDIYTEKTGSPDTWQDFLDVRVEYEPNGIPDDFSYENILECGTLKDYIRSIYDRYRTNGFPSYAPAGPTKRVVWSISIRN